MATSKQTRGTKTASNSKGTNTARKSAKPSTKSSGNYLSGYDWGRIMAKAWRDPDFKKRVEADPTTTIREFLGEKYKGVNIFNIPPKPADVDEGQLEDIENGDQQMYHCSNLC